MKNAKVRNAKSAVGVVPGNQNTVKGFLYTFPSGSGAGNNGKGQNGRQTNQNPHMDIGKHFDRINKSARNLYNLFTPVQAGTAPKEPDRDAPEWKQADYRVKAENYDKRIKYEKLTTAVNKKVNDILFYKTENGKALNEEESILHTLSESKCLCSESEADELITLALRASLRGKEAGVRILLCNAGRPLSDNEKGELRKLFELIRYALEKDSSYEENGKKKDSRKDLMVRSIENQNMVIQTGNSEKQAGPASFHLSLPVPVKPLKNGKEAIKVREKRAEQAFLSLFADLNEENRQDILRRLRRLMDTFFYAEGEDNDPVLPSQVDQAPDYNVWNHHEKGKEETGMFAVIPEVLINEASGTRQKLVEKKEALQELKKNIHEANLHAYRRTKTLVEKYPDLFFGSYEINEFWIHRIQSTVERLLTVRSEKGTERLLLQNSEKESFRFEKSWLCEKVWKDALNFMSVKYIALGKAVFHYAMEDAFLPEAERDRDLFFGKKDPAKITSFDYEIIKANETLQREVSVAVAFAANTLSRAVVTIPDNAGQEDFLIWGLEDIKRNLIRNGNGEPILPVKAMLQFFGGNSRWNTEDYKFNDFLRSGYENREDYQEQFLYDTVKAIFSLRNQMFHFRTLENKGKQSSNYSGVVKELFERQAKEAVNQEKNRFYSNNLPMFYSEKNLEETLTALYQNSVVRQSQIPSFQRILKRSAFPQFVRERLNVNTAFADSDTIQKWYSALYYVLKEIYYNVFTQLGKDDFTPLLKEALNRMAENPENERALQDFKYKYQELSNQGMDFSRICQALMTEYNLQNTGTRKVRAGEKNPLDTAGYAHYKMLLYQMIREAFLIYIKKDKNGFTYLFTPSVKEMPQAEAFLPEWTAGPYTNLISKVAEQEELQKWYITCRFMNTRMLNQLSGSLRSYVQYAEDVGRRARETGNKLFNNENQMIQKIKGQILRIVDLCIKTSSVYSNKCEDYFEGSEEEARDAYARFLSHYVDFMSGEEHPFAQLDAFCNGGESEERKGVYMDAANPIVNRNVLEAKLFGPVRILEKIVRKVTDEDFAKREELKKKLSGYLTKGVCADADEQKNLLEYQRLTNRIELRSEVEYGEIINELLGQLVNWSFLRERDLLYFQLGFHYSCLNNETEKPEGYIRLTSQTGHEIKNVILYQILAAYINGIGVYNADGTVYEESILGGAGSKISRFAAYSEMIQPEKDRYALYTAGLEIFEDVDDHDNIVDVRNYIDHFKYYRGDGESLLDLYSEIFDRFFSYDMKYGKNAVNVLGGILIRHFALPEFSFGTGIKLTKGRKRIEKERAQIRIKRLTSERFEYALPDGNKLTLDARDEEYLKAINDILYYPGQSPDNIVHTQNSVTKPIPGAAKKDKDDSKKRPEKGTGKKGSVKKGSGKKEEEDSESRPSWLSGSNPFSKIKLE